MACADHIFVHRLGGSYSHHGIDCGDDSVIHFSAPHWYSPRRVTRTSLREFARSGEIEVRNYTDFFDRLRKPEQLPRRLQMRLRQELSRLLGNEADHEEFGDEAVITRAESRLGESRFDIMLHNCEHFATWCKTGISDSEQVFALWRSVLDASAYRRMRRDDALLSVFEPNWRSPVRHPQQRRPGRHK